MKKTILLILIIVCSVVTFSLSAQNTNKNEAVQLAQNFIRARSGSLVVSNAEPLIFTADTVAWIVHCQPQGFVVISTSRIMTPVIAWSDEGNFFEGKGWETFLPIFRNDLATRKQLARISVKEIEINRQKWNYWLDLKGKVNDYQQWPPVGWTTTGGWLKTNWTQDAPYNNFCPIDGQTHTRSYAGCPATAMGQIVNYHHDLHTTQFSDADDYYHNYGTGNQYWIDNDWAAYEFPSWDQLNIYLDTLATHYQQAISLTDDDEAALTYAWGAAAKQVYSSSGSGTYGISQAYDAYIRFGYGDAQLLYPADTTLNTHLAGNMKLGLPAHLGLVNPAQTVGHNVVVDGYNTDDFYHFNFGWGGSSNGWYTMPPTSIPYDLTVIEGVVLDINLSHPPVGLPHETSAIDQPVMSYLNEAEILRVMLPENSCCCNVSVFDASGRKLLNIPVPQTNSKNPNDIRLNSLNRGLYIATIRTTDGKSHKLKFIK